MRTGRGVGDRSRGAGFFDRTGDPERRFSLLLRASPTCFTGSFLFSSRSAGLRVRRLRSLDRSRISSVALRPPPAVAAAAVFVFRLLLWLRERRSADRSTRFDRPPSLLELDDEELLEVDVDELLLDSELDREEELPDELRGVG